MHNKKVQIALSIVLFLFGFMIVLQFKSVTKNRTAGSYDGQRVETLQTQLSAEKQKNEQLYVQLLEYMDELNGYREEADASKVLSQQLSKAELLAGQTDLEGPGVIVTLTENTNKSITDPNIEDFMIHDADLLRLINELFDADAEAISINNERLIATSEIRCAGSTVSVNNRRYAAPFVIKAIGDPDNLESALKMPGGIVDLLSMFNVNIDIKKQDKLTVERFSGTIENKYAQPVQKEGQ